MSIVLENISAGYDGFSLKDINLDIKTGSFTALIGPNGCGKSTLLKTIGRIIRARSGAIHVGGVDVLAENSKTVARTIAYLPQSPETPASISVEQLVGYGRAPHQSILGIRTHKDIEIVEEAIEIAALGDLRKKLVSELSGGQRQRAFIAMSLAQDTPYIMLDEPTTFLDIRYQYETLDLIARLNASGRTSIVVLHDIAQAARYANHLVVMKEGRIYAQGTPQEMVTPLMIRDVYGLECKVYADPVTQTPAVSPLPI